MNFIAILACGVMAVVLGMLWYGPLFGRPWRKTMGITDEEVAQMRSDKKAQRQMMKSAALAFVFAVFTGYVLNIVLVVGSMGLGIISGPIAAIEIPLFMWLGFAVPVLTGAVLWESKSWKWWLITVGYYLVSWVLMGFIFLWL